MIRSGAGEKFFVVPMYEAYHHYASWFKHYGQTPPPYHPHGVIVAEAVMGDVAPYKRYVAGAMIYESEGPFAIVDRVCVSPIVNARTRHEALVTGAAALLVYGSLRSKVMMCVPNSKGMEKVLARVGFEYEDVKVMTARPD